MNPRTSPVSLAHVSLLVDDYDDAIDWLTRCLDFAVREDTPVGAKRWVTIGPAGGGGCSLVLGRAANTRQRVAVGNQFGGRVGFFLHVDDFAAAEARLREHDVRIEEGPRDEPYGRVLVFRDKWGNRWDLVGKKDEG